MYTKLSLSCGFLELSLTCLHINNTIALYLFNTISDFKYVISLVFTGRHILTLCSYLCIVRQSPKLLQIIFSRTASSILSHILLRLSLRLSWHDFLNGLCFSFGSGNWTPIELWWCLWCIFIVYLNWDIVSIWDGSGLSDSHDFLSTGTNLPCQKYSIR